MQYLAVCSFNENCFWQTEQLEWKNFLEAPDTALIDNLKRHASLGHCRSFKYNGF